MRSSGASGAESPQQSESKEAAGKKCESCRFGRGRFSGRELNVKEPAGGILVGCRGWETRTYGGAAGVGGRPPPLCRSHTHCWYLAVTRPRLTAQRGSTLADYTGVGLRGTRIAVYVRVADDPLGTQRCWHFSGMRVTRPGSAPVECRQRLRSVG